MKKILIVALVLCMGLVPALALADGILRVEGTATLSVTPDMAILSVGYMTEKNESAEAQRETASAITAIVEAVKALEIDEGDIVTAYLNTYPVYNYTDQGDTLRGYRVEHTLSITVRDLESVGKVLDAALEAGANQTNSIVYKSSKEQEVYLKALDAAIENAKVKAEAMAVSTGMWLGRLEEVSEQSGYAAPMRGEVAAYDMAAGSMGSTLMTGDLEISASVTLVYEIR